MNQSNKPASINQERSQLINRALILNLLRQEGICSRATLSRLSGLKQATITNIAAELIQCGLVVETGLIPRGKRQALHRRNLERRAVQGDWDQYDARPVLR